MGIVELGILLMMFSHHCILAPSTPLHKSFSTNSDVMQETAIEGEGANADDGSDHSDDGRTRLAHSSKFERGSANSGGSTSSGENGNNGGSRSPYTQGSNFVPAYTAGAANNRHHNNHHGGGNSNKKCIGLPTLFVSTWASLVHLYMAFRY